MTHIVSVDPVSGNLSAGVDVAREGALVGACPGAGNVQAREILEQRIYSVAKPWATLLASI